MRLRRIPMRQYPTVRSDIIRHGPFGRTVSRQQNPAPRFLFLALSPLLPNPIGVVVVLTWHRSIGKACPRVVVICAGTRRFHRFGCRLPCSQKTQGHGGFSLPTGTGTITRIAKMSLQHTLFSPVYFPLCSIFPLKFLPFCAMVEPQTMPCHVILSKNVEEVTKCRPGMRGEPKRSISVSFDDSVYS